MSLNSSSIHHFPNHILTSHNSSSIPPASHVIDVYSCPANPCCFYIRCIIIFLQRVRVYASAIFSLAAHVHLSYPGGEYAPPRLHGGVGRYLPLLLLLPLPPVAVTTGFTFRYCHYWLHLPLLVLLILLASPSIIGTIVTTGFTFHYCYYWLSHRSSAC